MPKPKILIQLDGDLQASVFDGVVAVDSGIDFLFRHGGVAPGDVRTLVHGAIFTRGLDELHRTAVFVGGADVAAGEALLKEVLASFFGPFRVSVMMDANGANTTAAAAVLAAGDHLDLSQTTALVLGGTGPVGGRVARLLSRQGAAVRIGSRRLDRAQAACDELLAKVGPLLQEQGARLSAVQAGTPDEAAAALPGANLVVAAGAAGVELLSAEARRAFSGTGGPFSGTGGPFSGTGGKALKVAIDLNAVPPTGLAGVEVTDRAKTRDGVVCYGAIGVGGAKMKIHKAAIRRLFKANGQVFDAEEIFQVGRELRGPSHQIG